MNVIEIDSLLQLFETHQCFTDKRWFLSTGFGLFILPDEHTGQYSVSTTTAKCQLREIGREINNKLGTLKSAEWSK